MYKKRKVIAVLLLLIMAVTLTPFTTISKAAVSDKDLPKQPNLKPKLDTGVVESGLQLLFWVPAGASSIGSGAFSDYVGIFYDNNDKVVRVARVIDKEQDGLANGYTRIDKISTGIQNVDWFGTEKSFRHNRNRVLFSNATCSFKFSDKPEYVGKYVMYSEICSVLNSVTATNKDTLMNIESLLRLVGDTTINASVLGKAIKEGKESVILKTSDLQSPYLANMQIAAKKADNGTIALEAVTYKSDGTLDDYISLAGFARYINELVKNNSDLSSTVLLQSLVDSCRDAIAEANKAIEEETDSDAKEALNKAVKEFEGLTAHDKWATILVDYINTDGGKTKSSLPDSITKVYAVNKFAKYIAAHTGNKKDGQKDSLTSEEVLRLKAFAYIACTRSNNGVSIPADFTYPAVKFSKVTINKNGMDASTVKSNADIAVKKYRDVNEAVTTEQLIASSFEEIVMYLSAKINGYETGDPFIEEDEEDEGILERSVYLESLIPSVDTSVGPLYYPVCLSQMTNLQYVLDSEKAHESYLTMQYLLLTVGSYAKNNAQLEAVDEKDYSKGFVNKNLDAFITENGANPAKASISADIKRTIAAYSGIYKGLKYLGVEAFTPQLKAICEYYNKIINFEENPALKAYDPSELTGEPMRQFFSVEQRNLSYYYNIGVSLSATYIPMRTNLYDVNSLSSLEDTSFVEQFHYPFGFYRKALYIDTNVKSAVDWYVTNKKKSKLRVATLRDLLEPEKDIMLYLDSRFYNVDAIAELQGYSYSKLANTEDAGEESKGLWGTLTDMWAEFNDTDIESIVKTGGASSYSNNIRKGISEYGSEQEKGTDYILSDDNIDRYLKGYSADPDAENVYNEYTPLQPFAVVSAVYRQSALFRLCNEQAAMKEPVFVSSPNLAGVKGIGEKQWNTIYNYAMLKNLENNMGIDYKTTLDLDSVLYMDLYGNIITESGLVVIPAASNATLYKDNMYSTDTAGFLSLYGKSYAIPRDYANSESFLKENGIFGVEETTNTWQIKNGQRGSLYINFRDLPVSDEKVLHTFVELQNILINNNALKFDERVYLITEVMRGAPIESIDKNKEGLKGVTNVNKYGVYFAYKLDELSKQLLSNSNGNSMISLPNLAYMEGVEYIVVFLFKIIFAITIFLLFIKVYMDAVQGFLGIKTFLSFITTLVVFVVVVFTVPNLMDFSYYQANKRLLQDEAEYIALINLEKRSEGREIGVHSIDVPESETTLYLKIDDLSIPWYEILDDILVSDTFQTMDDIYEEAFSNNLMSNLKGIIKKSNGLYMDVNHLFDTSIIEYDPEDNFIYQKMNEVPYASYASPYYVILDQLLARINEYNMKNEIKSFTTKTHMGGAVRTVGMIESFLTSDYFMVNSQDVLGFKNIYQQDTTMQELSPFSEEDLLRMQNSMWYVGDRISEDVLIEKLDKLDREARKFVADNRDLLSKVTDETFLKVMALSLAAKHNDIMGIGSAQGIEIFDIDSKDIIRLSVAPRRTTMSESSKSFARFIYDNGGTLGVVATAFLIVVYFVSTLIKPVCMLLILGCMVISLIFRKLIKRDDNKAIEGFVISLAVLCGTNLLYALLLKLSMSLQMLGLSMVVSIVLQIIIQIGYFVALAAVTMGVLSDWKNFGYSRYSALGLRNSFHYGKVERLNVDNFRVRRHNNNAYGYYEQSRQNYYYDRRRKTRGLTGINFFNRMKERDMKRERRGSSSSRYNKRNSYNPDGEEGPQ